MDLEDFNVAGMVLGIISGLFGIILSSMMMPGNIMMEIMVFILCAVAGYFVSSKILEG